jgi:hypothetical protein
VTLDELGRTLPNGFHDSEIRSLRVDYSKREVALELAVWLGDMEEKDAPREAYRDAEVSIDGLQVLAIEPPDPRSPFKERHRLPGDLMGGAFKSDIPAVGRIATGSFVASFFVDDWNSFIHVAARSASIEWRGEQYDRRAPRP